MMHPSANLPIDSSNNRAGITTIGLGYSIAPAISASLQIAISNSDYYHGPPQAPRVEAVHGTKARAAMVDVVAAIRGHPTVSKVEVVVPIVAQGMGRPQSLIRLDVEVDAPETDDLTLLLNDAARAAAEVDLAIGYVGASFVAADRDAMIREARRLAIEHAREQAEVQAELLGLVLGNVIASADGPNEYMQAHHMFGAILVPLDLSAPASPASLNSGNSMGSAFAPFDPATRPVQAEAYRRVVMTFEIA